MFELQLRQLNEVLAERGNTAGLEVHELWRGGEGNGDPGRVGSPVAGALGCGVYPAWPSLRGVRSAGSTVAGGSLQSAPPGSWCAPCPKPCWRSHSRPGPVAGGTAGPEASRGTGSLLAHCLAYLPSLAAPLPLASSPEGCSGATSHLGCL